MKYKTTTLLGGESLTNVFNNLGVKMSYAAPASIMKVKCSLEQWKTELSVNTLDQIISSSRETYGGFTNLIGFFQLIALAYIAIVFAKYVYTSYFGDDHKYAPNLPQLLKKIVVAILLTVALPYGIFTAYYASSSLGAVTALKIADTATTSGDISNYEFFQDIDDINVEYTSYCVFSDKTNAPDESSSGTMKAFINPAYIATDYESAKSADAGEIGGASSRNLASIAKANAKSNGTKAADEYTALLEKYNNVWSKSCGYENSEGTDEAAEKTNIWQVYDGVGSNEDLAALLRSSQATVAVSRTSLSGAIGIVALIKAIVVVLIVIVAGTGMIKRMIDCLVLIATGWYYVGGYVSDKGEQSLSMYIRKLVAICLTQYLVFVEFAMFVKLNGTGTTTSTISIGSVLFEVLSYIAWFLAIKGTPALISEITNTSGADSVLMKGIGGMVDFYRGK